MHDLSGRMRQDVAPRGNGFEVMEYSLLIRIAIATIVVATDHVALNK